MWERVGVDREAGGGVGLGGVNPGVGGAVEQRVGGRDRGPVLGLGEGPSVAGVGHKGQAVLLEKANPGGAQQTSGAEDVIGRGHFFLIILNL